VHRRRLPLVDRPRKVVVAVDEDRRLQEGAGVLERVVGPSSCGAGQRGQDERRREPSHRRPLHAKYGTGRIAATAVNTHTSKPDPRIRTSTTTRPTAAISQARDRCAGRKRSGARRTRTTSATHAIAIATSAVAVEASATKL